MRACRAPTSERAERAGGQRALGFYIPPACLGCIAPPRLHRAGRVLAARRTVGARRGAGCGRGLRMSEQSALAAGSMLECIAFPAVGQHLKA